MTKDVDAVYENGAFRPTSDAAITLRDGTRVRLTVEPVSENAEENVLDLASKVYAGLSDEEVADIERIATDRTHFFSQ
jgi:predicted DNA-binding antitoxin AbrB/MazE fold protein